MSVKPIWEEITVTTILFVPLIVVLFFVIRKTQKRVLENARMYGMRRRTYEMKDIIDGIEFFGQQISELRFRVDQLEKDIRGLKMKLEKKEGKTS